HRLSGRLAHFGYTVVGRSDYRHRLVRFSGSMGGGCPLRARHTGACIPNISQVWVFALALFLLLLLILPLWAAASGSSVAVLIEGVYRSGALVFGGGHVVLPLLQASVVPNDLVSNAEFLAGYGAAQAVPGPLFTFAAYLGALADSPLKGWSGGIVLLITIFVPALLVLVAALPFWERLRHRAGIQCVMAGVNA